MNKSPDQIEIDRLNQLVEKQQSEIFELKSIINNLPEDIYWKHLHKNKFVYSNINQTGLESLKRMGFKWVNGDIQGKTDYDLYDQATADTFSKNDWEVIQEKKVIEKEEIATLPSGKQIIQLSTKKPLLDRHGNVTGVLGISVDITELKQTQAALKVALDKSELANRSKSEFIQNMSHDIRNPLAAILGMAQILYDNIVDENKEYAHMLVQASERLLDLLNNVLDLASAAQENHLKQEPVELKQIAQGLKELLTPSLHPKQLQFNLEIDEQIPTVLGDANKIERILLNLLNNAIKFTEQGSITLKIETLHRKQDRIQFAMHVIDTGIGIPEDKLHRVFEEFFRVHPSYEGIYKGHGVGLYIVKKYTELMHGDVKVQSKLGKGTTFTITLELPVVEKKLELETDLETQANINAHILLVEDEALSKKAAQLLLQKSGYTVTTASTLAEAAQQLNRHKFDLILTDVGLGLNSGGFALAKNIRAQVYPMQNPRMPILALTSHGKEIQEQCFASGIDQVFTKPLNKQNLVQLRKVLLNKHHR
jgi:signal transduction histidine kinase/BarA-like signal transduction histidine kinase